MCRCSHLLVGFPENPCRRRGWPRPFCPRAEHANPEIHVLMVPVFTFQACRHELHSKALVRHLVQDASSPARQAGNIQDLSIPCIGSGRKQSRLFFFLLCDHKSSTLVPEPPPPPPPVIGRLSGDPNFAAGEKTKLASRRAPFNPPFRISDAAAVSAWVTITRQRGPVPRPAWPNSPAARRHVFCHLLLRFSSLMKQAMDVHWHHAPIGPPILFVLRLKTIPEARSAITYFGDHGGAAQVCIPTPPESPGGPRAMCQGRDGAKGPAH